MVEAYSLIILLSGTVFLSYVSSLIYSKTRIPDIVWLMLLGVLVGPVLGLFDEAVFLELAPLMSIIALSMILFQAGLEFDLTELLQETTRASLLSVASIASSILSVGLALTVLLPYAFDITEAMLLGAMIGGTSTVSVFSIMDSIQKKTRLQSETRTLLVLESILSDPIAIIISVTIIRVIMLSQLSVSETVTDVFSVLTLPAIVGLVLGMIWARILSRLRGRSYNYILTLAVVFSSYVFGEELIGSGGGVMIALAFGLALSNYRYVADKLKLKAKVMFDKEEIRGFHDEITFFVKSFFFVYIGLIVSLSVQNTLIGLGIVGLIMAVRYLVVTGVDRFLSFSKEQKAMSRVIYASGLPALVMSQLPLIYDPSGQFFANPGIYSDLAMPVVLGIVILNSLLAPVILKRTR